jgi:hypothetical protein
MGPEPNFSIRARSIAEYVSLVAIFRDTSSARSGLPSNGSVPRSLKHTQFEPSGLTDKTDGLDLAFSQTAYLVASHCGEIVTEQYLGW